MDFDLSPVEVRIVGSLIEKEVTTPEYYPLSLNAVALACNQKSNRDPVMSLADETVAEVLELLRGRGLVYFVRETGSRTNLADLALVCSNCHRMIHRRRPWLSVEVLTRQVRSS